MGDLSRVGVSGPLEPFASGFAAELCRVGYLPVSARFQLQLMAHVSRWLQADGLDASGLTTDAVERFMAARRAAGYTNYVTDRAMAPLLGYLRVLGQAHDAVLVVDEFDRQLDPALEGRWSPRQATEDGLLV